MKYLKLFEDFDEMNDNQFLSSGMEDDMQLSNNIDMNTNMNRDSEDIVNDESDSECKNCNCQCDSCICTEGGCQCTNCQCDNQVDFEDEEDELLINDEETFIGNNMNDEEEEEDGTHLSKFGEFNEKKMNAGFKAYLDKKKAKKKDDPKEKKDDKKDEKKDVKKKGLTAGQKRLPEAMQKAILKKQK